MKTQVTTQNLAETEPKPGQLVPKVCIFVHVHRFITGIDRRVTYSTSARKYESSE